MVLGDWLVDGVDLDADTSKWFVEWGTQVPAPGVQRVAQLEVPRRSGVFSVRQGWGTGTVKLVVAVVGGSAGVVAERAATVVGFLSRARSVGRRVGSRVVQADVVTAVVSEPERVSHEGAWLVSAVFTVAPFWVELPVSGVVVDAVTWDGSNVVFDDGK